VGGQSAKAGGASFFFGHGAVVNEREGKTSLWLLIGWVGSVLLGFTWRSFESFDTPKEALIKVGIAILGGIVILRWLKGRTIRVVWHPLLGMGLAFWGWGWLSLLVSPQSLLTVHAQLFALHLLLLLVLVPLLLPRRDDLERLWLGVLFFGGIVAALAVAQWFGLDYEHGLRFLLRRSPLPKVEIYSTIGNSNYLAAVLAFLFPVTIALAAGEKTTRVRAVMLWGCATVSIAALLMSRSKGGLVAVSVGLAVLWLVWGFSYRWSKKRLFLTGVGGLGCAALLLSVMMWQVPSLGAEWNKLLHLSWNDPSVKGRLLMWNTTLEMAAAHPIIGIGTGTFGAQYQPYRAVVFDRLADPAAVYPAREHGYDEAGHAHNDWLQVAAENGVVGLGLFAGMVLLCLMAGLKLLMERPASLTGPLPVTPHPLPSSLLCGLMAGMTALLAHALVDFPLHQPAAVLLFWLGMATVVAAGARPVMWPLPAWLTAKVVRWGASGVVVVGIGLLVVQAVRPVIAGAYQRQAWVLMTGRHWAEAIPVIRAGLRWEPSQPELTLYLGVAAYQQGDLEGSRAAYERYQSLYSDFQTLYNLGLIAVRQRRFDHAERYFREALRYKPTLAEAAAALALVAEQTGRPDEARRYRQQAVRLREAGA
jgi:O-antigen ligase